MNMEAVTFILTKDVNMKKVCASWQYTFPHSTFNKTIFGQNFAPFDFVTQIKNLLRRVSFIITWRT
jgi:hypothetical protein